MEILDQSARPQIEYTTFADKKAIEAQEENEKRRARRRISWLINGLREDGQLKFGQKLRVGINMKNGAENPGAIYAHLSPSERLAGPDRTLLATKWLLRIVAAEENAVDKVFCVETSAQVSAEDRGRPRNEIIGLTELDPATGLTYRPPFYRPEDRLNAYEVLTRAFESLRVARHSRELTIEEVSS